MQRARGDVSAGGQSGHRRLAAAARHSAAGRPARLLPGHRRTAHRLGLPYTATRRWEDGESAGSHQWPLYE